MKKLIRLKNGNDKCPHCGTMFYNNIESLHPFDVAVRKELAKKRSRAAKRGWAKRKNGLSHGQNRKRRSR